MNKTPKKLLISTLISVALAALLYYVFLFFFNEIGCDCGPGTEILGQIVYPTCGCASQINFARIVGPFVYILPVAVFIGINIFLFRRKD